MRIRPVGQHILVEVLPVEESSKGGIIIATREELDREHKGRDIGRIISFGPAAYKGFTDCDSPSDWGVKEGDVVEFERYNGKMPRMAETNEQLKNYRILYSRDIIAVLEEDNE